jgi:Methyltransferase domain
VSWDYGRLVAEVYELDKPVGSSFPGLRYYTRQLAGVTGRILEPATGTGRVLVPLLEAGFAVEGLDVSPDMLAVCRQHCQDRGLDPVLREADMTTFAEPGAYQAIIIPAESIMLLDGRDAVPRALAAFRESLSPAGPLCSRRVQAPLCPRYPEWVRMLRPLRSCHDTCRTHTRGPRAGHQPEGRPQAAGPTGARAGRLRDRLGPV